MYADGAETDSSLDNDELSVVVAAPLCPGDASKAIRIGNATAMLKNTRVRSVVPTPVVSYSVCHRNTRRQLHCLSSQHPLSATVSVVPTPSVSYSACCPNTRRQLSVCRPNTLCQLSVCYPNTRRQLSVCRLNTLRQLQCRSSQHPSSATATEPLIDLASAAVTYASVRSQLRLLVWLLITGLIDQSL